MIRPTLLLLQIGVFVLLLIGAVNLMNLLLVRANGRAKESALRRALGASAGHMVSEIVVETTFLTVMGGILGLAVAAVGIRLLGYLGADRLPFGSADRMGWEIGVGRAARVCSLGHGARRADRLGEWAESLSGGLQSESRGGTASRGAQRSRHSSIVAQIRAGVCSFGRGESAGVSLQRAMADSPAGFGPITF